jgi:hypothetical protein
MLPNRYFTESTQKTNCCTSFYLGFHEALGDLLALAVTTPEHLNSVGLLPEVPTSEKADINYLMSTALTKVGITV